MSVKTTKTPLNEGADTDELRAHYSFDYSRAKPNRFAQRLGQGAIVVVLDPDVAEVFKTSEAVNEALRVLITERSA